MNRIDDSKLVKNRPHQSSLNFLKESFGEITRAFRANSAVKNIEKFSKSEDFNEIIAPLLIVFCVGSAVGIYITESISAGFQLGQIPTEALGLYAMYKILRENKN